MFLEIMEQCVFNYFDLLIVVVVCEASRPDFAAAKQPQKMRQSLTKVV
jgi:hypothetical protein